MNIFTILCCWILLSCSKSNNSPSDPGITVDSSRIQYGTPYASVPDAQDAVIYQVNMRAFSAQANLKGVQDRLDSIQALGVNVLYLMPVYPIGAVKSVNSPYCVKNYTAVNSEFGTLDDLRALVAAAHDRHMAVMMDWVANHTSWDNAWIANKSWYQQDASGNIISPPGTGWNDVAQLNYQNADMRLAMIRAMQYWVYKANIDGYRCDAADFVPADFWKQAIDSLHAISTHKLLLLAEGARRDHFLAGFNMMYGMGFYYNMVNNVYAKNASVRTIDSVNNAEYLNSTGSNRVTRYISNHDVDNSDGTPLDLLGGKTGSLAAFIVSAFMNAAPMLYNGQEVGCPVKLSFFNNSTTINWTLNPDMTIAYRKLLALYNSNTTLRHGQVTIYSNADVCAFTKTLNTGQVLVLSNMRNAAVNYAVPAALSAVAWKDAFSGTPATVSGTLNFQPYEYRILIKQ